MAIHTLPNGASWDDELDFGNQSEEAQEFWENLQNTTPINVTEPSCNLNMPRLVSSTWIDTSNNDYDYKIIITRNYQFSATHRKAFALQSCTTQRQIISK